MNYLCNGFSDSMFRDPNMKTINYGLSESEFIDLISHAHFESVIGHQELADVLSQITGVDIPYNRKNINIDYDDTIIVVSMKGRLPEHPKKVDYDGRLCYSFKRFEKQTGNDNANTLSKINEIKEAV